MVLWSAMVYSQAVSRFLDLSQSPHPDDEEAIKELALLKHTFPSVDFDLTEEGLKKLSDFADKHFQNE